MAVPKKHTCASKMRIRKNIWKRKGYGTTLKAFFLGEISFYREFKKFFLCEKNK